ncbi:MAG: GNAT family N-acetyltransferase [Pseudomonadota bacterium]
MYQDETTPGGAALNDAPPSIRRAARNDLARLVALEECFPSDRLSRLSLRRLLHSPSADVLVHSDGAEVAGNAVILYRCNTRNARIYSLVVHPQRQRRGIARALLHAAERAARARGCRTLSLEVRPDNEPALHLYATLDYQPIRRIEDYYEDHTPALRLRKLLT